MKEGREEINDGRKEGMREVRDVKGKKKERKEGRKECEGRKGRKK